MPVGDKQNIQKRKDIYNKKIKKIKDQNKAKSDYKLGVNVFTFLTEEEASKYLGDKDD